MDYSRQTEVFDRKKAKPVHIIGCGATGSWVALSLAKLGVPKITLYDYDTVEQHNLPNQCFLQRHVGMLKVDDLKELLLEANPSVEVTAHNKKVEGGAFNGVVFMLVDSMKSRKEIFTNSVKYKPTIDLMVETRMDAFIGTVYTVRPSDRDGIKTYEGTLYSDEEAVVSICGVAQSLAPTASVLANLAVWQYIKHTMGDATSPELMVDLKFNSLMG